MYVNCIHEYMVRIHQLFQFNVIKGKRSQKQIQCIHIYVSLLLRTLLYKQHPYNEYQLSGRKQPQFAKSGIHEKQMHQNFRK